MKQKYEKILCCPKCDKVLLSYPQETKCIVYCPGCKKEFKSDKLSLQKRLVK